ncbi:MAG: hypothetical protein IJZ10_04180 [Thermoguttaceae bacterium]|nr:hypothetical protein [Thermoguttaceae bacterium]
MGTPMLVDSDWLDRANAALNALGLGGGTGAASTPASPGTASRFYDVRPARIHSGWAWDAEANVWRGKMSLAPDDYPWFDVCAPLRTQAQGAPYPRDAYVVWRGRWELLEDEIALQTTPRDVLVGLGEPETVQAVEAFPNPRTQEFLTGVAVDYVEDVPAVKIWTSTAAPSSPSIATGQGYVEYVESVALRDGELITTKKFLCWEITPRPFFAVRHSDMGATHPTAKALTALGTPTRATAVAGYPDVKTAAVVADAELLR